jgi:phosphatidylinositol alpha-mannosyltransferase
MISYYLPSDSKIGVGYQVHELATVLVARGHHVDVFSECPPVDGATYGHRRVVLSGRLRTFRFALHLRRIDFSSYDVLHAHGDDYWLWRRRVPRHIRTVHGSCFQEAAHIRGLGEKVRMVLLGLTELLASVVADETVVVSPSTRRWMPWVRRVIPNGVDRARFHPDPAKTASEPTVLFVGTWENRKRGKDLAKAFQRDVLPVLPHAQLEMVCRDAPAAPGPGITVLGNLSDSDLGDAYQRAWVFCLPSDYEGFGIPYAEAMASGVPIVATPNVGARYVTDDGAAGALAPLSKIGTVLKQLLTDEALRARLRATGSARADLFDLDRIADSYEALYRANPRRPRAEGRPVSKATARSHS